MTDLLPQDRLIVALDVPTADDARALVDTLGDAANYYKIGLELAMTPGYFDLLRWLVDRGNKVFCDLKLHDIPATVGRAVGRLADSGAHLLTVHAGQQAMLEAAAQARHGQLKIVAVTVLTSIDQTDLRAMGVAGTPEATARVAGQRALDAGIDGLVSSAQEIAALRREFGAGFISVTPGIRPAGVDANDQKRVMSPAEAIRAGSTHLVVGRPIRDADDPRAVAQAIQSDIAKVAE